MADLPAGDVEVIDLTHAPSVSAPYSPGADATPFRYDVRRVSRRLRGSGRRE
ncbi:MAG: hypothetical protein OEW19_03970 [Acidobacteriota bacterium]|nr:hypothetical protein [Acidobacteriota bacterium]